MCFVPVFIGATLGWLCATLAFLNGIREELITVPLASAVFYVVTVWGLREWKEVRVPLFISVIGGGFGGATLCPALSRVLSYRDADLIWFMSTNGPVDVEVHAILGGLLFATLTIFLTPMKKQTESDTKLT